MVLGDDKISSFHFKFDINEIFFLSCFLGGVHFPEQITHKQEHKNDGQEHHQNIKNNDEQDKNT